MSQNMEFYQLAPQFKNAIEVARLTTGQIGPMTDADELVSQASTNKSGLHYEEQFAIDRVINTQTGSLRLAVGAGVFTDANVAAANTKAGLSAILTALNADVKADFFSGNFLNQ